MDWQFRHFDALDTTTLFALMKLRVDVFVVEQDCAYAELDAHDTAAGTLHLLGQRDGTLVAYARAMPGLKPVQAVNDYLAVTTTLSPMASMVRIGRVVVAPTFRGQALGQQLMRHMITHLDREFPAQVQFLASQIAAQALYESQGFIPVSDTYLEDGIAHIDMLRLPPSTNPIEQPE